jgi:hypothetical protein
MQAAVADKDFLAQEMLEQEVVEAEALRAEAVMEILESQTLEAVAAHLLVVLVELDLEVVVLEL